MQISKYPLLLTIVGFIYLSAVFFFVLYFYNIQDLICFEVILAYHFYVVLIVVPLSYLFGLTVHKIINEIIVPYLLRKKWSRRILIFLRIHKLSERKYPTKDEFFTDGEFYLLQHGSQGLLDKILSGTGIFYSSRILFLGFLLLGVSLFCWLEDYYWEVLLLFILLSVITLFIYWNSKSIEKIKNDAIQFLKDEKNKG